MLSSGLKQVSCFTPSQEPAALCAPYEAPLQDFTQPSCYQANTSNCTAADHNILISMLLTAQTAALLLTCLLCRSSPAAIKAEAFCNGTEIKALKCDWAKDSEQNKVASGAFAGTLWTGEPNPPQTLENGRSYYSIAAKVVSLACKGPLTVRTVFKYLPGSQGCSRLVLDTDTLGSTGKSARTISRCQLRFTGAAATAANGTDAAAIQAALAAPENSCQECKTCATCPQEVGVWYSDTASFDFEGCAGVAARPNEYYIPSKPGVVVNPGNKVLLAGFTVKQA